MTNKVENGPAAVTVHFIAHKTRICSKVSLTRLWPGRNSAAAKGGPCCSATAAFLRGKNDLEAPEKGVFASDSTGEETDSAVERRFRNGVFKAAASGVYFGINTLITASDMTTLSCACAYSVYCVGLIATFPCPIAGLYYNFFSNSSFLNDIDVLAKGNALRPFIRHL